MGALASPRSTYSVEELEVGLLELACWRGNARAASRSLAKRGIEIPRATLQSWQRLHADRLAELEAEVLPEIRARMAVEQEEIVHLASEATRKILKRLNREVDEIPARDLAGAARNVEVTGATAIDKHSILHGLPTEIRRTENAEEILQRLAAKGIVVDGTCEEMPEGPAERQLSRASLASNAQDTSPQPSTSAPSEHDD